MTRRIAAVTIGQCPRPDLLVTLVSRLPADAEVIETGALDSLTAATLRSRSHRRDRSSNAYPLTTRLRDETSVTLDEADLAPLVQVAIEKGEEAGAQVTLLLCAGGFRDAIARGPLVRPFDAGVDRLKSIRARRLGVIVPVADQAAAAGRKWATAGFDPVPIVGDAATIAPRDVTGRDAIEAVVLDYVGHPTATVAAARNRWDVPVVDLGEEGAEVAARLLNELE